MSTPHKSVLREVSLFRALSPAQLEGLARQLIACRFTRHQVVFSQGDPGNGMYVVSDGHVSIVRNSPEGGELILTVHEPGEYFGELALFDGEPRSAGAVAADDCTLLFLSRPAFRTFLEEHPAAVFACLETIVRQIRRLTDLVDEIALLDLRSRLARRLLRLAEQGMIEEERTDRRGDRSPRVTQQQLASMTGATRESVNKHLNAMAALGLIRLDGGRIRIQDRAQLEAYAAGA